MDRVLLCSNGGESGSSLSVSLGVDVPDLYILTAIVCLLDIRSSGPFCAFLGPNVWRHFAAVWAKVLTGMVVGLRWTHGRESSWGSPPGTLWGAGIRGVSGVGALWDKAAALVEGRGFSKGGGVAGHEALQGTAVQAVPVVTKGKPPYQKVFSIEGIHLYFNFYLKEMNNFTCNMLFHHISRVQKIGICYSTITLRFFEISADAEIV